MQDNVLQVVACSAGLFLGTFSNVRAFENVATHPALTETACDGASLDSYLRGQMGLGNGIQTRLSFSFPPEIRTRIGRAQWNAGKTQRSILEWLKVGSAIEDTDTSFVTWLSDTANLRPRHHFHDATRDAGLNNKDDNPNWGGWPEIAMGLKGGSAAAWAINGTAPLEPTANAQSWPAARTDFYHALTQPTPGAREEYLAMTFLDLGCVLHMLEDMGVPPHVRNDFLFEHYRSASDNGSPLEKYVETHVSRSGGLSRWLPPDWRPAPVGFTNVAHYFDTNTRDAEDYCGQNPPASWGLAECTNYQFLSWSTIFLPDTGSLYYFPHPAFAHTTSLVEGRMRYRSGYGVPHLMRPTISDDYLRYPEYLDPVYVVIDGKTMHDYACVTIPRTIEYTAGLTDYFLRGRIELTSRVESHLGDLFSVRLYIRNKSLLEANPLDHKFAFMGGAFEVYWDDAAGNRSPVPNLTLSKPWDSQSTLAYNEQMWIDCADTIANDLENAVRFTVVYKGNIVEQQGYTVDADDAQAIAVATVEAQHIHNIPTTTFLLARFKDVNYYWFTPAAIFNNRGFLVAYDEVTSRWEANLEPAGRQITIRPTFATNRDRIFVDAEDDWNGDRLFHSGDWDTLEFFTHIVENDCGVGTACEGYNGSCAVSIWNVPDWAGGVFYEEGAHVGWPSPEGDCFEVHTCTVAHVSAPANQPGSAAGFWLTGYPDVEASIDIDGISQSNEEYPGGVVQVGGALQRIYTVVHSYWPTLLWPNELDRGSATLVVLTGSNKIRVWDNANRIGQAVIDQGAHERTWQLTNETVPVQLYVEGLVPSGSAMDVRLKFTVRYGGLEMWDKVNFTVQP